MKAISFEPKLTPYKIKRALKKRFKDSSICCQKDKWFFDHNKKDLVYYLVSVVNEKAKSAYQGSSSVSWEGAYKDLINNCKLEG